MKPHLPLEPATPDMEDFTRDVARTVVQQPDFRGIGGHGPETHGPHGPHSQLNIGLGNTTIDIRFPLK
jgi:hypothetical protein